MTRITKKQVYYLSMPEHKSPLIALLQCMATSPPVRVIVEPFKPGPTYGQRGLLHKWFSIIGEHTGYTTAEVKELLKEMFLNKVERRFAGQTRMVYPSTEDLTKQEYSYFMEQVDYFAANELGIRLPSMKD